MGEVWVGVGDGVSDRSGRDGHGAVLVEGVGGDEDHLGIVGEERRLRVGDVLVAVVPARLEDRRARDALHLLEIRGTRLRLGALVARLLVARHHDQVGVALVVQDRRLVEARRQVRGGHAVVLRRPHDQDGARRVGVVLA